MAYATALYPFLSSHVSAFSFCSSSSLYSRPNYWTLQLMRLTVSTPAGATLDFEVPENGNGIKRLGNAHANLPWTQPPPGRSLLASPLSLHSSLPLPPSTSTCTAATTATKLYPFLT
ncbi:hypothetical protein AYX14_03017 [Cryptococcus neoformans]|nr:hypothetical protein AYX15_01179 [Cryptococcus neoformans var. grubii]OWZ71530.1 hypothetical protein AYX14_03017 [Cryptococcus neoformans var. grubii]